MSIEIVAIGNEVLAGMILNCNATYLSEKLEDEGWQIHRHTVLPDDPGSITLGLQEALNRSLFVINTGGLGPMIDDITLPCAENIFDQTPQTIHNLVGSSSGFLFRSTHKTLILLPGVPQEMESIFEQSVMPFLRPPFPIENKRFQKTTYFSLIKELDIDPFIRNLKARYPKIDCGIYPGFGVLPLKLRSYDQALLEQVDLQIEREFKAHIFHSKSGKLEEAIQDWFISHKKTLACAESCTGGSLASHLTAIAGSSDYFLGSLVTYSNELKCRLLGVSSETLCSKGAVSEEAVMEMVEGLLKVTKADWGIAVSGIAGPGGGTPENPVGTIWYAIGEKGQKPIAGTLFARGTRQMIILQTVNKVLGLLWKRLSHS